MKGNSRKSQAGFTLVELLIALILVDLLSLAIFASLRISSSTLANISLTQRNEQEYEMAAQVVSQYLKDAYPEYITIPAWGTFGQIEFDGEPQSIRFLSVVPEATLPGGLARMRLWGEDDGRQQKLMISESPELAWAGTPVTAEEMLVGGISGLVFSYYGADEEGGNAYWHKSWTGQQNLPELIRVHLQYHSAMWPDLLVAPEIKVDEGCELVPLSMKCLGR